MSWEPLTTLATRAHLRTIENPEPAQRALLRRILARLAGSATAASLGLKGDESFEEFLGLEPRDYAFYEPLIGRVREGDRRAFGRDPVIALGMTSGSTGKPKLVPYNERCRAVFAKFVRLVRLFQIRRCRSFWPKRSKWLLVTAPSGLREVDGLPVGFVSGLMYHGARSSGRLGPGVLPSPEVAAVTDWDERHAPGGGGGAGRAGRHALRGPGVPRPIPPRGLDAGPAASPWARRGPTWTRSTTAGPTPPLIGPRSRRGSAGPWAGGACSWRPRGSSAPRWTTTPTGPSGSSPTSP